MYAFVYVCIVRLHVFVNASVFVNFLNITQFVVFMPQLSLYSELTTKYNTKFTLL